ncbi:MAG: hypothetical protein COA79_07960 [Planctomycetota bacterium]|nr:MAG: hypothetical protein COA79_07960 [Planctomycetota bacterium]
MTSRIILLLNHNFDSIKTTSDLTYKFKQLTELGFENIAVSSALALRLFQQEIKLDGLLLKAICYSNDFEADKLKLYVECHHEYNCNLALTLGENSSKFKLLANEFVKMGLKVESCLTSLDDQDKMDLNNFSLFKSPLGFNPIPMQAKLLEETKEVKRLIDKFLKLNINSYLLIDFPDLNVVDLLKQAKDNLNRLYFLQTR